MLYLVLSPKLVYLRVPHVSGGSEGQESAHNVGDPSSIPGSGRWQPTPVFLPAESHGQRSLAGYSPWGCKEADGTERLSLSLPPLCVHIS